MARGKQYFLYKRSKKIVEVSCNDVETLDNINCEVEEGYCFEITEQVKRQKELEVKKKEVEEACNWCGECNACVDYLYLADQVSFDKQVIDSTLAMYWMG